MPPPQAAASLPAAPPRRAPRSVLIVDDEPDILASLRDALEASLPGIRIRTALTAADALAQLEAEPADVLIADYRMPEMDGVEFLRRSKALAPHAAPILITAFASREVAARAAAAVGPTGLLLKPFRSRSVIEAVRGALARKP